MRRTIRWAAAAALAAGLALGAAVAVAVAQDGDEGFELAEGVTHEGDLFAGGERVVIRGTVDGNLFAGGLEVIVEGTVRGDVFAGGTKVVIAEGAVVEGDVMAGGTQVDVAGRVAEDVRVGGYIVRVLEGAEVGGEVMAGGYSVDLMEGASVATDLYVGGYQLAMGGDVGRDARIGAAAVDLSGTIGGDATIEYGDPAGPDVMTTNPGMQFWRVQVQEQGVAIDWPTDRAPGLRVDDAAEVEGELVLRGPVEVEVPEETAGDVSFEEVAPAPAAAATTRSAGQVAQGWLVDALKRYLALLLVGAVVVALAPRVLAAAQMEIDRQPLASSGWGCLTLLMAVAGLIALFVGVILGAIVLAAAQMGGTLGGLLASVTVVAGVLLTFGMAIAAWLAEVAVGLWLGRRLTGRPYGAPWLPLAVGLVPVALVVTLPVIGGWLRLLAVCIGLGGLALSMYRARTAVPPAEALAAA